MATGVQKPIAEIDPAGVGVLVFSTLHFLSDEQRERVRHQLHAQFPGRGIMILDGGATLHDSSSLARIEAKVDLNGAMLRTLIEALAEDEPEQEQVKSLDGTRSFRERDSGESLG